MWCWLDTSACMFVYVKSVKNGFLSIRFVNLLVFGVRLIDGWTAVLDVGVDVVVSTVVALISFAFLI